MNKICLLIVFIAASFHSFSQNEEIEKLKKVVSSKVHDTVVLQALSDLNWVYGDQDLDLSEKYGRDELKLAKKIKDKKWEAQALNDIGISKYKKAELDSALHYYKQSFAIRQTLSDKSLSISSLSKIGVVHQELGNYNQALKYQFEALELIESVNNDKYLAMTLNNIGIIYDKIRNYDKEISYIEKAIKIHTKNGDDYSIAQCYGNMATAYKKKGNLQKSNDYLNKALVIFTQFGDKVGQAGIYNSIGMNLRTSKKNAEALAYYKKAYDLATEAEDKLGIGLYGHNISCVLTAMGKYAEAEKYELTSLKETEKTNNAQLMLCYRQLASIYTYLHDGKTATLYLDKYTNLKDSVFNTDIASQMGEMEVKFQSEKTKRELAEERERVAQKEKINADNKLKLESRRKWLLVTITFSVLLLGAAIWIYRSQRIKRSNEKREFLLNQQLETVVLEKGFADEKIRIARELHDNIGSHLTFMISSLDNLTYDKNAESKLEKITDLSNFGRLTMKDLRDTIWAMNHDGGTVEQLITRISELRAVLPDKLKVEIKNAIHPEAELNGLQLLNCFRIVQEFFQNSIKYAEADKINVSVTGAEDGFVLSLKDNGKGFEMSKVNFGNGILNMKRRCEDLGGTFEINASPDGTDVVCRIPWKI